MAIATTSLISMRPFPLPQKSPIEFKGTNRRLLLDGRQCKCMSDSVGTEVTAKNLGSYRPAVILPGLGNNSSDYQQLASSLEARGVSSVVAKVSRPDWLRNGAGLLDGNYWKGTLRPRPVLDWYLERIEKAVSEASLLANGRKISLIGHSAGGWLARVYLAEFGVDRVSLLLTLGTPHLPPPKGVPGVIDQTRGLLDYVEKFCPAACYGPQLKYVCIAGRYLKGERLFENTVKGSTSKMESIAGVNGNLMVVGNQEDIEGIDNSIYEESLNESTAPTLRARFVGQGYKQVCGQADVWGDGVVPEVSAHLEGAKNIILEGVYHSPIGSNDISTPWYGSSTILDKWVHHLLD
uniref:AB hydrolase-1 domain-containing protein n=1 Tax=Picea sitchensis TaxID=3332 RepID=C0PQU0_PICSI|nr:unknown [Picea sitchensis]